MNWKEYFERTKEYPPRELLIKALPFVYEKKFALDVGSGALNESGYLLSRGFEHITALDIMPVAKDVAKTFPADKFSYEIVDAADFAYPDGHFDLINAQYSLPFMAPDKFAAATKGMQNSLKNGGIFTGQLFGEKDEWNIQESGMTFHTLTGAKAFLSDFEVLFFEETESDKPTALGSLKHWHVFDFIAKKI